MQDFELFIEKFLCFFGIEQIRKGLFIVLPVPYTSSVGLKSSLKLTSAFTAA
jgi:hypothetical protein